MFVSSANYIISRILETLERSLMYSRKSSGPRIETWGTPHLIL